MWIGRGPCGTNAPNPSDVIQLRHAEGLEGQASNRTKIIDFHLQLGLNDSQSGKYIRETIYTLDL